MNRLQRLHAAGGQFKFLTKHLDGTGLYRNARIAILVAIAMLERVWVSERIKTGQVRSAKKPGRTALSAVKVADVSQLLEEGISFKKIQLTTGAPVAKELKYLTAAVP